MVARVWGGAALILALATMGCGAAPAADTPPESLPGDLVLTGGWRFDVAEGVMVPNRGILIRAGRLMSVDGAATNGEARVITLDPDQYILPGLIDVHAHYEVELWGEGRADEFPVNAALFLANGVTTTFPAGESDPEAAREARLRIDTGGMPGPRIINSGPRFGTQWEDWDPDATPEDVHRLVDEWVQRGVRGFKAKGTTPAQLRALIERAHAHGLTVTGHLMSRDTINPRDAILAGIDRVEHYLGGEAFPPGRDVYDSLREFRPGTAQFREIVALYLRHRVYYDPTITAFGYLGTRQDVFDYWIDERQFFAPAVRARLDSAPAREPHPRWDEIQRRHRATVKAFYDAGGAHLITLGTDTPARGEFVAGFNVHRELHNFVLAGIPPAAALRFGTLNGARALNLGNQLGSIDAGKLADLFVVRGDPLDDIRNTRNVEWVVKNGTVYDPGLLMNSVLGAMGATGPLSS